MPRTSFFLGFAGILLSVPVFAQETADSFIPNYSAGGAYYLWTSEADFDDLPGRGLQMSETGVNIPIPLKLDGDVMAFAGVRFRYNQLSVDGIAPFAEDLDLYRLQIPVNVWIRHNEKWKFWLRAEPGLHTDFEDISSDDFVITALGLVSYQWTPRFRTALGAYFSRDLGEERVLPAVGFIWEPNEHWSFSITAPRIYISYAPEEGSLFTGFAYPGGAGWNVTNPETGENVDLDYQNIRAGFSVQKALFGPVWAYAEGGYQFYQSLEVEGGPEFDAEGSWFASGGIQLRF